jgi:CubicO group peptidase (beta-lactamase class C family)
MSGGRGRIGRVLTADALTPDRVEPIVDEFFAEKGVPSLAYGVVVDGVLVHSGGRGLARIADEKSDPDADTVYRIASMTKSFTAAALLALRDEGLLSLEDPVASWVPQVQGMGLPTGDSAPLTVRQLLTMTGGLPTDDPWGDRQQSLPAEDFDALVAGGLRMAWPNGTAFEYSNTGYALLGRVVAAVSGQEYSEAVTKRVLGPLGMTSTVYASDSPAMSAERLALGYRRLEDEWIELPFDAYGAFAPMGGLFSTVRDLARWVGGFTDAFPARDGAEPGMTAGGHPLRRASRREMQQPHRLMPPSPLVWTSIDTAPVMRVGAYGFGLFVDHDAKLGTVVGHSGGYPGFGSNMRWHPDSGVGVVVLANATYAHAPRLGAAMLSALLEKLLTPNAARARAGAPSTPLSSPVQPPRSGALWPETVAAQADVERLVWNWDDEIAGRLLAMNVDLDEAMERRSAQLGFFRRVLGPFSRDDDAEAVSDAPSHLKWWMRGPGGRLQIEIRLTPQLPPLVQTLAFTGVPHAPAAVQAAAEAIVATFADEVPQWPEAIAIGEDLDAADLTRLVRMAALWAGATTVGDPISGDGKTDATFRLNGTRAPLLLSLTVNADPAQVTRFTIRPA